MKIVIHDLVRRHACGEARDWFIATFPAGGELSDVLAACDRDDWVCWYACKISAEYRWWCAGEAFASAYQATHDERLKPYVRNVTPDNCSDARRAAAAAAADAADAYAYAADAAYDAADAAADADAAAYATNAAAYATRKLEYKRLRAKAERVLLAM